jgi:hypothetical protein
MSMHNFRKVGVALLVSLLFATGVAWAANGPGWSVILNAPVANTTYAAGANIGTYSGTCSWTRTDDSIDLIGMYSMSGNGDPTIGTQNSSNYAT